MEAKLVGDLGSVHGVLEKIELAGAKAVRCGI